MARYEAVGNMGEPAPESRFSLVSPRETVEEAMSPFRHSSLSPLGQAASPFLSPIPSLSSSPSSSPFRLWAQAGEYDEHCRRASPGPNSAPASQSPCASQRGPLNPRRSRGEPRFGCSAPTGPPATDLLQAEAFFPRRPRESQTSADARASVRQPRNSFSFPPVVPESPFCKVGASSLSLLSKKPPAQTPFRVPSALAASPASDAHVPVGEATHPSASAGVRVAPSASPLRAHFSVSPSRFNGLHGTPGRGPLLLSELDTPFHLVRMNKGTTFLAGRHAKTVFQPSPSPGTGGPSAAEAPREPLEAPAQRPPTSVSGGGEELKREQGGPPGAAVGTLEAGVRLENFEGDGGRDARAGRDGRRDEDARQPSRFGLRASRTADSRETEREKRTEAGESFVGFYTSAEKQEVRLTEERRRKDAREDFQDSFSRFSPHSGAPPLDQSGFPRHFESRGDGPFSASPVQTEAPRGLAGAAASRANGDSGQEMAAETESSSPGNAILFSVPSPTTAAAAEILRSRQLLQKAERMLRAATVVAPREKPEEGRRSFSEPRPQSSVSGLPRPSDEENVIYAPAGAHAWSVSPPAAGHLPQSAAPAAEAPNAAVSRGVLTPHGSSRADPAATAPPSGQTREDLSTCARREAEPRRERRQEEAQASSGYCVADRDAPFSRMHASEASLTLLETQEGSGGNPLLGSWLLSHAEIDRERHTGKEEGKTAGAGQSAGVQEEPKSDGAPKQQPSRCTTAGSEPLSSSSSGIVSAVPPGCVRSSPQRQRSRLGIRPRAAHTRDFDGALFYSSLPQMGLEVGFSHDAQAPAERRGFSGTRTQSAFFLSVDSRVAEAKSQSTAAPSGDLPGLGSSACLPTEAAHRLQCSDTPEAGMPAIALPPARSREGRERPDGAHAFLRATEAERAEEGASRHSEAAVSQEAPSVSGASAGLACSRAGHREEEGEAGAGARWGERSQAGERTEAYGEIGQRHPDGEVSRAEVEQHTTSHSSSRSGSFSAHSQQVLGLHASSPVFRHSPFPLSPRETGDRGEHPLARTADFGVPATDTENTSPLSFRSASSKSISSSPSSLYHRGLAAREHFSFSFFSPFRERSRKGEAGAHSGGTSPATGSTSPHLESDADGRGVQTPEGVGERETAGQGDSRLRDQPADHSDFAASGQELQDTRAFGGYSVPPASLHPGAELARETGTSPSVSEFPRHACHNHEGYRDSEAGRGTEVFPVSPLPGSAPHRSAQREETATKQYEETRGDPEDAETAGAYLSGRGRVERWRGRGLEGERDSVLAEELRESTQGYPNFRSSGLPAASASARRAAGPLTAQAEVEEEGWEGQEMAEKRIWEGREGQDGRLHGARGRDPCSPASADPRERDVGGRFDTVSPSARAIGFPPLSRSGEVHVHPGGRGPATRAAPHGFVGREEHPHFGRQTSLFEQSLQAFHEDFLEPSEHASASSSVSRFQTVYRESQRRDVRSTGVASDGGESAGASWRAPAESARLGAEARVSLPAFAADAHGCLESDAPEDAFEEDDLSHILPMVQFVNAELLAAGFEVLPAPFPPSTAPRQRGPDGFGPGEERLFLVNERVPLGVDGSDGRPMQAATDTQLTSPSAGRLRGPRLTADAAAYGRHAEGEHRVGQGRGRGAEDAEAGATVERETAVQRLALEENGGGAEEQRGAREIDSQTRAALLYDTALTVPKNATDEAYIQSEVYVHRVLEAMTDKLHEVLAAYRTRGERMGELRREASTAAGLVAKCNGLQEEKEEAAKQISLLRNRVSELEREKAELSVAAEGHAGLLVRLQEAEKTAQTLRGQARLQRTQLRQKEIEKERLAERLETVLREEQSREARARRALENLVSPASFALTPRGERGEKRDGFARRVDRGMALTGKNANKVLVEVARHYEGKVKALQREVASLAHALEVSVHPRDSGDTGGNERRRCGGPLFFDEEETAVCMHFTTVGTHPETWREQKKRQASWSRRGFEKLRISGSVPSLLKADHGVASAVWTAEFTQKEQGKEEHEKGRGSAADSERTGVDAVALASQRRSRSVAASTSRETETSEFGGRTRFSLSCCSEGRGTRRQQRSRFDERLCQTDAFMEADLQDISRILEHFKNEKLRLETRLSRSRCAEEETQQRLRGRIVELENRVEELEADLRTRPTLDAHRLLQQQLLDLQDELNPKKQASWRHADPRSLMRQDRLQRTLRSSTMGLRNEDHAALLQTCCLAANCSHPEKLPAVIQRLIATSHKLPPLECFFEFVALLAVGRLPTPSEADVILSSLVAMSVARHAHRNYTQLRRAFAQAVERDSTKPARSSWSFAPLDEELEDLQARHSQQIQRLQQTQLAVSSSGVYGNDEREQRVKATLSLLRTQHRDAVALFQKAAQEETQALWCLLPPRPTAGRGGASAAGEIGDSDGDETTSREEKELVRVLQKRLVFASAEECADKVQAALGRVDALAGFFRILCEMLQIPTSGATFAQVEAAVSNLVKENQQQHALLEEQQKHLLRQQSLLLSLHHSASTPLPTIRESKREDEEEERESSPQTGIHLRHEIAQHSRDNAGANSGERHGGDPRDVCPDAEANEAERSKREGEQEKTERDAHAAAAVATVNALQQLLKVDRVTLILPKLSEILGRVQRLTNAPAVSPELSATYSASPRQGPNEEDE
ncbi:hypothetical protein TGPRC2_247050 [Toxoplasma gondii TgCatPRC2]|uniref:Uncharacterized protein n=1 Tax=Toxoplasma gondii TgCatPRC2 TaxID=1130821 RepID=A0A151HG20_TOXGO|nr:hypothetical protein TGPRC2_247050 [Toxoplasma gondii TgCatPRC2]